MIPRYFVLRRRIESELEDVRRAVVTSLRPAVLRGDTANRLDEYLRFRHLVRNLYTWNFDADKLGALVVGLPGVLADLEADLNLFGGFLEAAGHADAPMVLPS